MDDGMKDIYDEKLELEWLTNTETIEEWKMRWQMCVVQLICYIVHAMHLLTLQATIVRSPTDDGSSTRDQMRQQLMHHLLKTDKCRDVICMSPHAFLHLCEKLRSTGRVRDSSHATVEEQVARFLHILAHNVKTRTVSFFFHRSGETISRHFHHILRAIISLENEYLVQPSRLEVPSQILNNTRFYPYFKVI